MQFFNRMKAILNNFVYYNGIRIPYLDSSACIDLILTELLFLRLSKSKIGGTFGHISAILDFYDMYRFETYINGFLDLEYPNFVPKHGFLSSVEADIKSFCQIRQPFSFSALYVHPLIFQGGSPSKVDK